MILLHGPNGSSKTTPAALVRGLEAYSREDEGMLLRFNWVFEEVDERGERLELQSRPPRRGHRQLRPPRRRPHSARSLRAQREPDLPCPAPRGGRSSSNVLVEAGEDERERFILTRFLPAGPLPKSRRIYDALIKAYHGDWAKVMRHVQAERFDVSRRYRQAAVAIEPQGNMDAGSRQIGHATMNGLPPILQNEDLRGDGDLVDGNGGIVEYSESFEAADGGEQVPPHHGRERRHQPPVLHCAPQLNWSRRATRTT
ncbi:MAG: hypothetical protein R3F20_12235 [Planctomycetota bacterium]